MGFPPGWTLNCHIQSYIDIYLSTATFKEVQRAFPYLVSKEFASGGGDVGGPTLPAVVILRLDLISSPSSLPPGTRLQVAYHRGQNTI
jgi:hypothetical protein